MVAELEAAIFDLGGVLTTPILESFAAFEESIGVPAGTLVRALLERYSEAHAEPDFHLLETGRISEAEYYRRLGSRLRDLAGVEVALPEDPVEIRRGLLGRLRPNEEMIEAARRIGARYKTALLTNNVREWSRWREFFPLDLFDAVVDSSEVGLRKPDPAIYRLTCERLEVEPARAAFVDDIASNVEAARAVGLVAIHFTTTDDAIERLRPLFPKALL